MKKGIIFIGLAESGKSRRAFEIATNYKSVIISRRERRVFDDPFAFSMAEKDTELIVIDDFASVEDIEWFFSVINNNLDGGIIVNKIHENTFVIKPLILITMDCNIGLYNLPKGASFSSRFDVYKFPYDGEIEFNDLEPDWQPVILSKPFDSTPSPKLIESSNSILPCP